MMVFCFFNETITSVSDLLNKQIYPFIYTNSHKTIKKPIKVKKIKVSPKENYYD